MNKVQRLDNRFEEIGLTLVQRFEAIAIVNSYTNELFAEFRIGKSTDNAQQGRTEGNARR